MAQDLAMSIVIAAQDQASKVITDIGRAFGPVGSAITLAGAALVDFGTQSVQTAAKFQSSMNMVQSLTGATTQQMNAYSTGVKQLASDTGVAATQLTDGLYFMTSAGYKGADALKMLALSTKDAVIGQTDAKTTANALSTAMRGFGVDIGQADAVNGMMLRTVTAGKMTMSDYASAISKTSSVAVQYHDSMLDMNAVLATLTSNGIKNANIAGTDYNNLLKVLNGNTSTVAKNSHALNSAFDETKFASMSVADKVQYLNTMIVQHGHNISEVIGKQQNAAAAFTVLANNSKMYADNLKNLGDAQANANATQNAWAITQGGLTVQMNRMQAALQNVMIDLGNVFLPILTQVMSGVTGLVTNFTSWEERTHAIETAMSVLGTALSAVWSAIQQVGTVVSQVWDAIAPMFDGLASQAQGWGSNMMSGFINGVESMIGELVAMLEGVASEIANFLGFASPTKKGPGRNLMTWGPAMVQSFARGIVASGSSVQDAVSQIAQIASDGLNGVASGAVQAGANAGSSSSVSISSGLQTVSLGTPFGMTPGSGSSSGAKSNPIVTALASTSTALATTTTKHAAAIAASTTKHAAAVAAALAKHQAALAKHAATVAAATQKHAASVAAAATKHAASLAKHAASAAASAAKHQAAMQKHAEVVAAALKKHQEVLAREAANQAKRDAAKAAKGAKGGGGSAISGLSDLNSKMLDGLKVPTDLGKQISQSVTNGLSDVKTQFVSKVISPLQSNINLLVREIKPVWDAFTAGIMSIVSTVKTQYIPAMAQAWAAVKPLVTGIADLIQYVAKGAASFAIWMVQSGALASIWNGLVMYIKVIISIMSTLIGVLATALAPVFKQIVDTVKTQLWPAFQGLWQALLPLMPAFKQIAMLIGGVVLIAIGLLISILAGLLTGLGALIAGVIQIFGGIVQVITGAVTVILGVVAVFQHLMTGNFSALGSDLATIWGGIVTMFKGVWNVIAGVVTGFVGMIVGIVGGFITTIISYFQNLYNTLVGHSIIPQLAAAITTIFVNLARNALTFGQSFVQNLINGITSMAGSAASAAANIAQNIKNQLGFHSPTKEGPGRDSDKWAPSLIKMMSKDFDDDGAKKMKKSAQNVAKAIASGLNSSQTQAAIAAVIHTSAGVALPNYQAGTGQTIRDMQAAPTASASSSPIARDLHIHVHLGDSDGDAQKHGKKVADAVKKELGKQLRSQSIAPRYTSGGR